MGIFLKLDIMLMIISFFPIIIIKTITPNNHAFIDIPKVVIQAYEYVIGNVDLAENKKNYELYQVWIPHDSYMYNLSDNLKLLDKM